MDMFFKTKKSIIKMKDKIEIEGKDNSYLTTSSLNGEEKCVLAHYSCKEQAREILDKIDKILDKAIANNSNAISIEIPSK